jgi:hypothetical protein
MPNSNYDLVAESLFGPSCEVTLPASINGAIEPNMTKPRTSPNKERAIALEL